jgi:hypothetical protein
MDRPQEMSEGPPGYVSTLLPRLDIRRTKVNVLVDPGIDHVRSRIREVVVGASRLAVYQDLFNLWNDAEPTSPS